MSRKKIIIIVIAILAIIFVGLLIYNLFFTGNSGNTTNNTNDSGPLSADTDNTNAIDEVGPEDELIQIAKEVVGYYVFNNIILSVNRDGIINETNLLDASTQEVANISSGKILKAFFNPNKEELVALVNTEGGGNRWISFDLISKRISSLPKDIISVSFSLNNELTYTLPSEEGSVVILSSKEGDINIYSSPVPDLKVKWLNTNTLILTTKPSGLAPGVFYLLNTRTKNLTRILGSKNGIEVLVSINGERAIFSETNRDGRDYKINQILLDDREQKLVDISTVPERCVFSQDDRYIFCSTISSAVSSLIMPDEYYKEKLTTQNSRIIKINLESGFTELVERAPLGNATILKLTKNEDYLLFVDKINNNLYRLKLK